MLRASELFFSFRLQTLNEQLKKLDDVRAQTDELLFQMIPKQVADRLRYLGRLTSSKIIISCYIYLRSLLSWDSWERNYNIAGK